MSNHKARLAVLALAVLAGGCTIVRVDSRSDPARIESRGLIKGHAAAVYLYGKTLPGYVGEKGYAYQPGISADSARVPYIWSEVVAKPSGGIDGEGSRFVAQDVYVDPPDCEDEEDCDDDRHIDEDCESFLDPAAIQSFLAECDDRLSAQRLAEGRASTPVGFRRTSRLPESSPSPASCRSRDAFPVSASSCHRVFPA